MLASMPGQAGARRRDAPSLHLPHSQTPDWILIPIWLDQAWARRRSASRIGAALARILWGEYALFLSIRIQDDLFDEHRDDRRLLFVADRFLLESLESFQRFAELDDAFWAFYRSCVRDTVDGILEVGRLETEAGRFTRGHLGLHSRVGAIFKVGAAAVSRLRGHDRDMAWLSRLQDQLAIVSQIRDDLQDVAPDLKGGRFTWVGNTLLQARAGESIAPDQRARRLAAGFMIPERAAVIVEEMRRTVRAAAAAVPESAPRPIHDLVHKLTATPDEVERHMHEARVRWVFGDAVAEGQPTAS